MRDKEDYPPSLPPLILYLLHCSTPLNSYIGVFSKPANTKAGKPEGISMTAPVIMPQGLCDDFFRRGRGGPV